MSARNLFLVLTVCWCFLLAAQSHAAPLIIAQPTSKSAFAGDSSATFAVLAGGTPAPTYQWQVKVGGTGSAVNVSGTDYSGGTTSTLTINNPTPSLNGNIYRCVVTSGSSINSAFAMLSAYPAPTMIPAVVLSSSTVAANSGTNIAIQINGLDVGDTVRVKRVLDLNGNGKPDIGEPLAQSFGVTDGQVTSFGGVRNPKIPGDDDLVADGQITTHISLVDVEMGQTAGGYLIQIASPSGKFKPITKTLTVTQPDYGQSVSGQITSGGSPIPNAMVAAIAAIQDGGYVASAVSDASGNYTLHLPAGDYMLLGVQTGYVGSMASAPSFTLGAGQTLTAQNLTMAAATCAIAGKVQDVSGNPSLKGVQLGAQSDSGDLSLTLSDADGNYVLPALADSWKINAADFSLPALGYLTPENNYTATTTTGITTALNLQYTPATALVYGTVKDASGTPMPGISIAAGDNPSKQYWITDKTDANGNYFIGVSGTAAWWWIELDSENPGLAGYIAPGGQQIAPATNSATQVNFTTLQATAHLQGTVTNNGVPVSGVNLGVRGENTNTWISTTTGGDGSFNLDVAVDTWYLQLSADYANANNLVGPILQEIVADNQTISGIAYQVKNGTGTIHGSVHDSSANPVAFTNVYGTASIGGVNYNANCETDGNGSYSFPVISGTWSVGVNSSLNFSQQTVTVTSSSQVDFAPPPVVAHLRGRVTKSGVGASGILLIAWRNSTWISATTDSNGNFDVGVTSNGAWNVSVDSQYAILHNILGTAGYGNVFNNQDVSDIAILIADGTGTIHGSVKDASNNPVASANVFGFVTINNASYNQNATTDSNGNYSFPVISGTWTVNVSQAGYTQQVVTVIDSAQVDFALIPVVAHLTGTVKKNGVSVSGIVLSATKFPDAITVTTDTNGNFDIGVTSNGTWTIGMEQNYAYAKNLVGMYLQETVANNQSISNIEIQIADTTTRIDGCVRDSSNTPLPHISVWAAATIGGVTYVANGQTDNYGYYGLLVVSGTWVVGVNNAVSFPLKVVTVTGAAWVDFVPSTPFQIWQQSKFSLVQLADPNISGMTAKVPSGAGFPNLMAYALGLEPGSAKVTDLPTSLKATASGTNYLGLHFVRNASATDIAYVVQGSSDLIQWDTISSFSNGSWSVPGIVVESGTAPNFNVQVQDTVPMPSTKKRFLRLQVVQ